MKDRPCFAPRCTTATAPTPHSLSPSRAPSHASPGGVFTRSLLAFVSLAVAAPLHASNSVPDWVHAAAAQTLPTLPPSARAVVLLDEETYTVAPDGRATRHERKVVKILRPQGRSFAIPEVWYDKDSKITSFHVWSIDPAGHEYTVKDNEMFEEGPSGEGGEFHTDSRVRLANPPGRDPGGIIAYEYEQHERPYVEEADWFFQGEVPRFNQSFTLVLPPGFRYQTVWARHEKVEPTELPNSSVRWEVKHESGIDLSEIPLAPSFVALASRMIVHYSGPGMSFPPEDTWQGVGKWYDALAHDRITPTPEISAKAAELTAGKPDFFAKTEAISEFVQKQIRYFVIEMGIGGNQPHFAQDIFHGRYGDCKDKATLLSAMLSSVGIHSDLLLVDTRRGFVDPNAPSVYGNHMIAAVEIPAGYSSERLRSVVTLPSGKRYLIVDPTWEKTPFGQLERELQGGYAVLVEGSESQLIQLPVLSPDFNRIERSGSFSLTADGILNGNVTQRMFGDQARDDRYIFNLDAKDQQHYLDRSMANDFAAFTLSEIKVANLTALNKELTVDYHLDAEHFAAATGPLLMVRPRVLGSDRLPIDRKQRKLAINLGETMQARDSFDIDLPEGYTVDELPDPIKVDVGFATYESSTEVHGRTLHYSRTYRVNQVTLPPEKYPDLQKLVSLIASDEDSRAVLKRSN